MYIIRVCLLTLILFGRSEKTSCSLPGEPSLGEKKNGSIGLFDPSNARDIVGKSKNA